MAKFSLPCAGCGKETWNGDKRCEACGAAISDERRAELRRRAESFSISDVKDAKNVRSATDRIAYAALVCGIGGPILYALERSEHREASEPLHASAATGLSGVLETAQGLSLVASLALAAIFLLLWWAARRAPFPALLAATLLFTAATAYDLSVEARVSHQLVGQLGFAVYLGLGAWSAAKQRQAARAE